MRRVPCLRVLPTSLLLLIGALAAAAPPGTPPDDDPLIWLEEVEGAKALAWAKAQNGRTLAVLERVPEYEPLFEKTLEILDSQEKIPYPTVRGDAVYNFWQDRDHPRGVWRRTTLASYRTPAPAWETVLDLDALAARDGTPWVWKRAECLQPAYRRCMVSLSRGGSDATVVREFDTVARAFVEGGFSLPEAKSFVSWFDLDTLWVGTDFGPGSLTDSGYPRLVKLWKRGTPLGSAKTVYEAGPADVAAGGTSQHTLDGTYSLVVRTPAFFKSESFLYLDGRLVRLDLPEDANLHPLFKDRLLVSLRSDWTVGGKTYPQGALLTIGLDPFLRGERDFEVLFTPTERSSLEAVSTTRDRIVLTILDHVASRLVTLAPADGGWKRGEIELPGLGSATVSASSDWDGLFAYTYSDFLTPTSLYFADEGRTEKVKSTPAFFSTDGMAVDQREATSRDGTRIPYFLVTPKGFEADGKAPTLLYGYGGFEVSMLPTHRATVGASWVERGGVYVLANLRGGGEFGPRWHEAALKENRIKSFEDFLAVAEDLIATRVTSPRHLGIEGGSQGGLLVGGAFTMRPDLFGAVVAQVPLADMRRFNKLLAGASWMAEYGDPDVPEEWAFIQIWSPYHLLKKDARYPTPFFWTNTRDDRVHPGHARKMVAKMLEQGHPVYYFENIEGGHGSGGINRQKAMISALEYAYLWKMLR